MHFPDAPLVVNISASELCVSHITRCEQLVEMVQYIEFYPGKLNSA